MIAVKWNNTVFKLNSANKQTKNKIIIITRRRKRQHLNDFYFIWCVALLFTYQKTHFSVHHQQWMWHFKGKKIHSLKTVSNVIIHIKHVNFAVCNMPIIHIIKSIFGNIDPKTTSTVRLLFWPKWTQHIARAQYSSFPPNNRLTVTCSHGSISRSHCLLYALYTFATSMFLLFDWSASNYGITSRSISLILLPHSVCVLCVVVGARVCTFVCKSYIKVIWRVDE